jgi:hypothetical protein
LEIHKPKPWHGWREFLKEYLIIVVGVLTALAAEQAVEWVHTRFELAEARDALHAELAADVASLSFAVQEDRCWLRAMDLYEAWARGGPKPQPITNAIGFPGLNTTVWDEVKAGAVLHMPLEERLAYARFYANGANQLGLVAQDRALAREISQATAAGTLDAEDAKALLKATSARNFLRIKIRAGEAMIAQARALGAGASRRWANLASEQRPNALCSMVGMPLGG